jgi:hypothetical protein
MSGLKVKIGDIDVGLDIDPTTAPEFLSTESRMEPAPD